MDGLGDLFGRTWGWNANREVVTSYQNDFMC